LQATARRAEQLWARRLRNNCSADTSGTGGKGAVETREAFCAGELVNTAGGTQTSTVRGAALVTRSSALGAWRFAEISYWTLATPE